jgi:hypothetical protein
MEIRNCSVLLYRCHMGQAIFLIYCTERKSTKLKNYINNVLYVKTDRLCGLVVRVPAYRSGGPGSIPAATRFAEK